MHPDSYVNKHITNVHSWLCVILVYSLKDEQGSLYKMVDRPKHIKEMSPCLLYVPNSQGKYAGIS